MRSIVLMIIGLGISLGGLPLRMIHAQSEHGLARLSTAAYAPDSPATESHLFRHQTGHYGFAYNCDGEEAKRSNPAICWQTADGEVLPKRMGCWQRVRHEVAQVSQRILDGMCESDCNSKCDSECGCQQNQRHPNAESGPSGLGNCGCANCMAGQGEAGVPTRMLSLRIDAAMQSQQAATNTAEPEAGRLNQTKRRRSGLIHVAKLESASKVDRNIIPVLAANIQAVPNATEVIQRPTARISSATVDVVANSETLLSRVRRISDSEKVLPNSTPVAPLGLVERLKRIQSAQASNAETPARF